MTDVFVQLCVQGRIEGYEHDIKGVRKRLKSSQNHVFFLYNLKGQMSISKDNEHEVICFQKVLMCRGPEVGIDFLI